MKIYQSSVVLLALILSSYSLGTDIKGGYSKQRLGLLFMSTLENHYSVDPLSMYVRDLPLQIVDHSSRANVIEPLLQILEQEHWLSSSISTSVLTLRETTEVQTQVTTYFANDNSDFVEIKLGDIRIAGIAEMFNVEQLSEQAETEQYDVLFLWTLRAEQEWIWASQLDGFETIQILRAATLGPQTGKVRFVFSSNQWQLVSQPSVYDITSID